MRAIVLSGGGSNGAYQIGVWKALKKLGIKYDIVTGTSVGAINGAMMIQKTYHKANYFWQHLNYKMIFDEELSDDNKDIIKTYTKNIIFEGGMKVSKLEELLRQVINIKKFYRSKIDYGLVTFKLTKLKPIEKSKKDIPKEKLIDYIMASATCFPAFQKKTIDNEDYIDGGYYDNLPINLAIKLGATEVIAVDLNCIGIKQPTKKKNIDITYITPRSKLGSFLVFEKDRSTRAIKLGYNDTLKTFKKLDGNIYTFKKNNLLNYINKNKTIFEDYLNMFFPQKTVYNTLIKNIIKFLYKNNKPEDSDTISILFGCAVDFLGKSFEIDETLIYKIENYNKIIFEKFKTVEPVNKKINLIKIEDSKSKIKYLYNKIEYCINNNKYSEIDKNILLFPKEFISALYLYVDTLNLK